MFIDPSIQTLIAIQRFKPLKPDSMIHVVFLSEKARFWLKLLFPQTFIVLWQFEHNQEDKEKCCFTMIAANVFSLDLRQLWWCFPRKAATVWGQHGTFRSTECWISGNPIWFHEHLAKRGQINHDWETYPFSSQIDLTHPQITLAAQSNVRWDELGPTNCMFK